MQHYTSELSQPKLSIIYLKYRSIQHNTAELQTKNAYYLLSVFFIYTYFIERVGSSRHKKMDDFNCMKQFKFSVRRGIVCELL